MRINIFLQKAQHGKSRPDLTDDEVHKLVPNWSNLDEKDRTAQLEAKAIDRYIILDGMETYASIITTVAKNMKKTVNTDDDVAVGSFLDDFAKLSLDDRKKYGVWA